MANKQIIDAFMQSVVEKDPLQKKKIMYYIQNMNLEEREKLARRMSFFCRGGGETIDSLANAYTAFCGYFTEERIHFVRTGTYRYRSLKEVEPLYENVDYMHNYMIGLCLSIYLWQIQRDNMRFFIKACREDNHTSGRYLEVGPGHGEYFVSAMENTHFHEYIGVDISATAVEMTQGFTQYATGNREDYHVLHENFFDYSHEKKFQGIVMGEVLEHVDNPLLFLKKVYALADDDAFIFLSTAINSPYPDHIYHFHNKNEIYELFNQANLRVKKEICTTSEGVTLDKAIDKKLDIVTGFVLEKANTI